MNKYFLLLSLTVISCSKGDEVNITTSNNVPNNEVSFVNSGNIYFENNTCKCPFKARFWLYLSKQWTDSNYKQSIGKVVQFSIHKANFHS